MGLPGGERAMGRKSVLVLFLDLAVATKESLLWGDALGWMFGVFLLFWVDVTQQRGLLLGFPLVLTLRVISHI